MVHLTYYPPVLLYLVSSKYLFLSSSRAHLSEIIKRTPKWTSKRKLKKICTLAEPCYYSLSRSRSFRNCRVALLLCLFAMELTVFFYLLWLALFLMLSSAFILFIIILIFKHARFFKRKISHPSTIHIHSSSIHHTAYLPLYLIYLQDKSKMRLWLSTQI